MIFLWVVPEYLKRKHFLNNSSIKETTNEYFEALNTAVT